MMKLFVGAYLTARLGTRNLARIVCKKKAFCKNKVTYTKLSRGSNVPRRFFFSLNAAASSSYMSVGPIRFEGSLYVIVSSYCLNIQ